MSYPKTTHNVSKPYSKITLRSSPPMPQSYLLSRRYKTFLPTSLTYVILNTRGYEPMRPDVEMSTDYLRHDFLLTDFHGPIAKPTHPIKFGCLSY